MLACAGALAQTTSQENSSEQGPSDEDSYTPVVRYAADGTPVDPCRKFDAEYDSWLDRYQVGLFRSVCMSAAWFDGFFGDGRYDEKTGDTYGRLSVGGFYDRRDSFDDRVRLRAKYAFPAARRRASVFIAQDDEDAIVREQSGESTSRPVESISRDNTSAVFAGFGFDRSSNLERGLSIRVGAKLGAPVEPYTKVRYRYGWRVSDSLLLRLRPVVYWKKDERFGATLGFQADKYLGDSFLLRWDSSGNVSQDKEVEGMLWRSSVQLFQALSDRRALTYSTFVAGETESSSKLQNYGVEFKFRHRFLRDWLFLEYVTSATWPKKTQFEEREFNPGVGLRFEVYFGPHPEGTMR